MKKERITIITFIFFSICFHSISLAQSTWEDILSSENGVVREQKQEVEISINDDGELDIISNIYEVTEHFNDNALLYSEQSIGFSETFTEISNIEAYSLVPNHKGKLKKIEVEDFITSDARSDGIFYDDQKKISFVFPALSAGAQTVLSYTKTYREPRLWGYYMFSSFLPVEKSEFHITTSEDVKLNYILYGIDESEVHFHKESKGKNILYHWEAKHLNKIQISKGADGVLHTAPHLIIYVDSYTFNGQKQSVLGDVKDLHAWYENFLNDIDDNNDGSLEQMVSNIIEGKTTELEKVEAIYYWVQQNVKYIAIEDGLGGFRPRSAQTVLNRRYGDCKDMSNLLHNMLNIANIPSNLAWIGTKRIPYTHQEVPTPMADNHMICTYKNGSQYFFLDATDQYNTLGMPTTHIQGREALIHKGTSDFELVNVPVVSSKLNRKIDSVKISIEQNQLNGFGKIIYSGYNRIPVTVNLENLHGKEKKVFLNNILNKGNNKFLLNSVQTKNVTEKNRDLEIEYNFTLEDYVLNVADEIYINPHLEKEMEAGLIDVKSTREDIHYPYKNISSHVISIEIPEGYEVSYLPNDRSYSDSDFGFDINYKLEQNKVIMKQDIDINTIKLETSQFDSWNKMMKELFAAYKESIVLQKQ